MGTWDFLLEEIREHVHISVIFPVISHFTTLTCSKLHGRGLQKLTVKSHIMLVSSLHSLNVTEGHRLSDGSPASPSRAVYIGPFILQPLARPQLTYTSRCALCVCLCDETYLDVNPRVCVCERERGKQYMLGFWQHSLLYIKLHNVHTCQWFHKAHLFWHCSRVWCGVFVRESVCACCIPVLENVAFTVALAFPLIHAQLVQWFFQCVCFHFGVCTVVQCWTLCYVFLESLEVVVKGPGFFYGGKTANDDCFSGSFPVVGCWTQYSEGLLAKKKHPRWQLSSIICGQNRKDLFR